MSPSSKSGFTLFGDPGSGNCLKPGWTADLLGMSCEWVTVDVVKGDTRKPEFLAVNPAGHVPVASWPDVRVLPQSNAIMLYLAEGLHLMPGDSFGRGEALSWLFWEQYAHESAIAVRRYHKHFLKKPDREIDPALTLKGYFALSVMEGRLQDRNWFVGNGLSVAVIAHIAYTRLAHEGGFDLSSYPSVDRCVIRVEDALGIQHARNPA
jgi:glutathione S-transferase